MKYIAFPIKDTERINNFISAPNRAFAQDMVKFHEDYITFFYVDGDEAVSEMDAIEMSGTDKILLGALEKSREITLIELASADLDVDFARHQALKGKKGATELVIQSEEVKKDFIFKLNAIDARIAKIKAGEFDLIK